MNVSMSVEHSEKGTDRRRAAIRSRFGTIHLPHSRYGRLALGATLVLAGLFGFLPVLGYWMIPLGFYILSHDLPMVRRFRRVVTLRAGRRWRRWRARGQTQSPLI